MKLKFLCIKKGNLYFCTVCNSFVEVKKIEIADAEGCKCTKCHNYIYIK